MNPDVSALLSDYKITVDIVIAWSDMDALQHVNNAVYLTYFETARIAYFDALGLRDYRDEYRVGPILGSVNLRYRIPLTYPDTVTVGTRITELREDRFEMDMLIVSHQHKKIAASGGCTTFAYDYNLLKKATWPAPLNQRMIEFEQLAK